MDVFAWMAEHVAIRGLDDPICPPTAHYLSELPSSATFEPFPGYVPPQAAPPRRTRSRRRIECLMAAHQQARTHAQRQLEELRSRQSTSPEELAAVEAVLERLGPFPQPMASNTDDAWLRMKECASPFSSANLASLRLLPRLSTRGLSVAVPPVHSIVYMHLFGRG